MPVILTPKSKEIEKKTLFENQNGVCPICKRPLQDHKSSHLDHDHSLEGENAGKVRGLLCVYCNVAEGRMRHQFNRSGLAGLGIDYVEWLGNLMQYLHSDLSKNNIHPQYVTDIKKQFARKTKSDMLIELDRRGIIYEGSMTMKQLVTAYNKQIAKVLRRELED